eukprot:GHVO01044150.1.p2 GENE.GHVO01044150.1~~GHVO01044150.1.p2  ORF type:complete len:201 (+),score=37.32 GHVO01044150.1:34-603(+)
MGVDVNTVCDFPCDKFDDTLPDITAASRLLLIGSGADELMGGYGRHLTAMKHGGETKVKQMLIDDVNRLWQRNMGRDDRITSGNGKEGRYPYLDSGLVSFITSLPIEVVLGTVSCNCPKKEGGDGPFNSLGNNKWIIRSALRLLDVHKTSLASKRAMQFGSGSAKMTNSWHFASNRKAKGTDIYICNDE